MDWTAKLILNIMLVVYLASALITIDWYGWWATIGWLAAVGHVLLLMVIMGQIEADKDKKD